MKPYELTTREVCWDEVLIDYNDNVEVVMNKPQKKNIALLTDSSWEGNYCGYSQLLKVGDTYRMYYRAANHEEKGERFCVAESKDGKTFTKKILNQYEYKGSKENNIFFMEPERFVDNFSVHYDENPNCPADEKFKALSLYFAPDFSVTKLYYYKSSDGLKFEFVREFPFPGVFDSLNVVLWNESTEEYYLYMRDFHDPDGSRSHYDANTAMEKATREVRLTKSKDFINWTEPKSLEYSESDFDYQLYTNNLIKYKRSNVYLGIPSRYIDRVDDQQGVYALPQWNGERTKLLDKKSRLGSAVTDNTVIVSRDGFHFRRSNDAFMVPPIENETNWIYGDCYVSHGVIETTCDDDPTNIELSFLSADEDQLTAAKFYRYTIRLDGYFSWHANAKGGRVKTVPVTFDGNELHINFKTSAFGHIRIQLCYPTGNPIEGYDSYKIFGNSNDRIIKFEKPLSELKGQTIRMNIELKDADLYSFSFEK